VGAIILGVLKAKNSGNPTHNVASYHTDRALLAEAAAVVPTMTRATPEHLDVAALLPGVGVFGGVRRFIEIGNEMARRGHRFTLYHPEGNPPAWLPFAGETRPTSALQSSRHQIVMCNDPSALADFENARADLKLFYFVLENIRGERAIARHPGWTILANSSGMRDRLRRRYGVPVESVIGGINLDVFKPRSDNRGDVADYRVLAFGRVSRRKKGVPIVVRAVEDFDRSRSRESRSRRPLKLVLFDHVGPGNERDPRNEIRCRVPWEFHLNLAQADLATLYSTCDAFVSAEKRAGWANTVAEALACGLPVVCTRSGTRDIALHLETAWVARWRHRYFLKQGLRALDADPGLARRLSQSAVEHMRRFSWPRVVDQLEDVVGRKLFGARG
jgi:glycosyltransferase involved in cell wall biosynthesis